MTAQLTVCRLCCDTVKREDTEIINESVIEMLQTLLVRIDLTISENPLICTTCRKKLEQHYNFKKKCIFTEESITPFVAENVKINLKEIRSQIIKAEELEDEDDHNVCRLCLEFIDHDMMLNDFEKEQFQQFFPEVDLSRTSFVVLCSTCYDFLHKYFIFVTSCMELEQQLCNYFLDQSENKIDLTEEKCSIKLDDFQEFVKSVKEVDEKKDVVLNEELDIKCDTEGDDERCVIKPCSSNIRSYSDVSSQLRLIINGKLIKKILPNGVNNQEEAVCISGIQKRTLLNGRQCVLKKRISMPYVAKITLYKCQLCNVQFKDKNVLKGHLCPINRIKQYQCTKCPLLFPRKVDLDKHMARRHSILKCKQCDKVMRKCDAEEHILLEHMHSSETDVYKCAQCHVAFKREYLLNRHVYLTHPDPSKIIYKCEKCNCVSKQLDSMKNHVKRIHFNFPNVKIYKCEQVERNSILTKCLNKQLEK